LHRYTPLVCSHRP